MRIFLLILFFLFVSALIIISNGNLHLKDKAEAMQFGRIYYSWVVGMVSNVFQATGYVVGFEWMPSENNTLYNSSRQ